MPAFVLLALLFCFLVFALPLALVGVGSRETFQAGAGGPHHITVKSGVYDQIEKKSEKKVGGQ